MIHVQLLERWVFHIMYQHDGKWRSNIEEEEANYEIWLKRHVSLSFTPVPYLFLAAAANCGVYKIRPNAV